MLNKIGHAPIYKIITGRKPINPLITKFIKTSNTAYDVLFHLFYFIQTYIASKFDNCNADLLYYFTFLNPGHS